VKEVQTHKALTGLPIARTLIVGRHKHGHSTLLDVADATRMDARAGGQGVAVKLAISTDPADAPADQDAPDPMPTTTAGKDR
jgi:hypothetical protein